MGLCSHGTAISLLVRNDNLQNYNRRLAEQMARQIKDDTERFARLVKEAKVVLE